MSPQHPPRLDHWPQTLRSAALRRGTLARCGPGLRPVSWPETPETRCAAIADRFGANLVAAGDTAGWIWGARRSPGPVLEFTTRTGRPPMSAVASASSIHEYRLEAGEAVRLGAYPVTSRERTAFDLLRAPSALTIERRAACRLLLIRSPSPVESLLERAARSSKPDRGRVAMRLAQCYGAAAVREAPQELRR